VFLFNYVFNCVCVCFRLTTFTSTICHLKADTVDIAESMDFVNK
jgi:hypothetical protein